MESQPMIQTSLFNDSDKSKPHENTKKQPTRSQTDKIWENIKQWNTIEGIELYEPLYNLYSQLFILTINHKLACLNYYTEDEIDDKGHIVTLMYAEIDDTWYLPMKERYRLHQELIEQIKNNDSTLEYDEKVIDSENLTLFSFL